MPVIGHETVAQHVRRVLVQGLAQHVFEGLVVARPLEQRQARNGTVEGVVDEAFRSSARVLVGWGVLSSVRTSVATRSNRSCCVAACRW